MTEMLETKLAAFNSGPFNRAQSQLKQIWGSLIGNIFLDSPYESNYKALKFIGCRGDKTSKVIDLLILSKFFVSKNTRPVTNWSNIYDFALIFSVLFSVQLLEFANL